MQVDRPVQQVPEHYRCLVQEAAATGLRCGELTGLMRHRLDLLADVVRSETLEDSTAC